MNVKDKLVVITGAAGIAAYSDVSDDKSPGVLDLTIDVNLTGVFNLTRAFLPQLTRTRGARAPAR